MTKTKLIGKVEKIGGRKDAYTLMIQVTNPMYMHYAEYLNNEEYGITFDKPQKARTLQQNALLWELIGKICKNWNAKTSDAWEMYCELLFQAKAKFTYVSVVKEGYDDLAKSHGIRAIEPLGTFINDKGIEFVNCRVFLGTSQMNTKEISQVIEKAMIYAEELGIDTNYYRDMELSYE